MSKINKFISQICVFRCKTKEYLATLPKVSIVIVFFDEYLSMLKRTLHSIVNRTPRGLLLEIIMVNDNSTLPELYEPLTSYCGINFGDLVIFREMKERKGMIGARLEGARIANGEVLVIFIVHFYTFKLMKLSGIS